MPGQIMRAALSSAVTCNQELATGGLLTRELQSCSIKEHHGHCCRDVIADRWADAQIAGPALRTVRRSSSDATVAATRRCAVSGRLPCWWSRRLLVPVKNSLAHVTANVRLPMHASDTMPAVWLSVWHGQHPYAMLGAGKSFSTLVY
jgi:hypothetical protein